MVSASHDQTLRVWTFQGDCIAELVGHTALVYNASCSDDGSLIASASEDNTVRTWRPDGQCLQTIEHPGNANCDAQLHFSDHTCTCSLLSSCTTACAILSVNALCTSAEFFCPSHTFPSTDANPPAVHLVVTTHTCTARRLPSVSCLKCCTRPAGCAWDVAWLPSNDLVTACADYTARVFTSRAEQAASAETVAGFVAAVEARKQPQQAPGQDAAMGELPAGLKMEEASVLLQPGKKDGETKIVKEGGAGVAYSWDAARWVLHSNTVSCCDFVQT